MLKIILLSILPFVSVFAKDNLDTLYNGKGKIRQIYETNNSGKKHGLVQSFKNESLRCHTFYQNGKKHGQKKCWHPNGMVSDSASYSNGNAHGTWTRWDEQGKLESIIFYNMSFAYQNQHYFKGTNKIKYKRYLLDNPEGPKIVVMNDTYNQKGDVISQIRNGNGIEKKYNSKTDTLSSIWLYENGFQRKSVKYNKKNPAMYLQAIPKERLKPWDVEKYGFLKKK